MRTFEETVEEYKNMIYGIALTRVTNVFDADDIFQEVFLTYYTKKIPFRDSEHEKAWLIRVTIICCKRLLKNRKKHDYSNFDESFHTRVDLSQEDIHLYLALTKLEEKYRIVLYLYYFEELSVDEISKALKLKSGAIRMQMSRGREMLKVEYEKEKRNG